MDQQAYTPRVIRRINFSAIYRTVICIISCAAIFTAGSIKLSGYLTPKKLEELTLGQSISIKLPVTLWEHEVMDPGREGLLKEEIHIVEEKPEGTSQKETEGVFPITDIDMSCGARAGDILVRDSDSGMSVDTASLLYSPYPSALSAKGISKLATASAPLVLIIHTHATECYTPEGVSSYSADTSFRSEDISKNMVAVGAVMAEILTEEGIPTIHCQTLHDAKSYNDSYTNSLASVKEYLKKYPSIKYVFDLHRDAIIREDGENLKPVCSINGVATAQTMTLVGTNAGGADHPDWQTNNMNLAVKLQNLLTADYPAMARPINTRKASFNQQYAPGSLLFEIGSCANTLSEAKAAVTNLSYALASLIKNH